MSIAGLQPGAVLQPEWDDRPIRVLTSDNVEVLYDAWWDHLNNWGLTNFKGKAYYYRLSYNSVQQRTKFLRVEPLSEKERAVIRPDLPLRLCRNPAIKWSPVTYSTIDEFALSIKDTIGDSQEDFSQIILPISEIVLHPFGPKGGDRKNEAIRANNPTGFSTIELLWHAQNLQAKHFSDSNNGVGIYRLGHQSKKPSYYLWGFYDRAGFLDIDNAYYGRSHQEANS